jgi:hypothetical protein
MEKACIQKNCSSRVVLYCECSRPATYMCKNHPGFHMVQKGEHNFISLVFQPSPDESEYIHQNIRKVLKLISEVRLSIVYRTKQLFESIYRLEKEAIKTLEHYEKRVKNLYGHLTTDDDIYKKGLRIYTAI